MLTAKVTVKNLKKKPNEGMKSELRCQDEVAQSLLFWGFPVSTTSALIESSSLLSRSSSASNYILFSLPVFCPFEFLLLVWLGFAADHRLRIPTTTPFQYALSQLVYATISLRVCPIT